METIIVEVAVGITDETYDFILPAHVNLDTIIIAIIDKIEQFQPNILIDRQMPMLIDSISRAALPLDKTLAQSNIHDGSRLMIL